MSDSKKAAKAAENKVKTTIRVNGGTAHEMDEDGNISEEGKADIRRVIENNRRAAGGVAVDQLKSIIARVERLEEDKAAIAGDIRDVFAEAKGNGFDVKALRTIIKLRKMDANEREEQETILETYMNALGMLPLFEERNTETMLENQKVVDIAKKIWEVLIVIAYTHSGVWRPLSSIDQMLALKLEGLGFLTKMKNESGVWVLTDEGKVEALKAKAAA